MFTSIMPCGTVHVVSGPGFESVPQPSSECGVSGDGGSEVVVGVKGQTPPTDRGDGDETRGGGKVYSKLRETCLLAMEMLSLSKQQQ